MQTLVKNISQIFACILDPDTFPEKAYPFLLSFYFSNRRCFQYLELFPVLGDVSISYLINNFYECVSTNVSQHHTFIEKQYRVRR